MKKVFRTPISALSMFIYDGMGQQQYKIILGSFFIGRHGTKSFGRKSPSILKVNAFHLCLINSPSLPIKIQIYIYRLCDLFKIRYFVKQWLPKQRHQDGKKKKPGWNHLAMRIEEQITFVMMISLVYQIFQLGKNILNSMKNLSQKKVF